MKGERIGDIDHKNLIMMLTMPNVEEHKNIDTIK
jgi:hypothetical protein